MSAAQAQKTQSESSRRRVGRPSKIKERREEILDAFLTCAGRYGLAGATADRIASELGVSRTLVFHYFGNRDALLHGAAERFLTRYAPRIEALPDEPIEKRHQAIVNAFFEDLVPQESASTMARDCIVMAGIVSLSGRDPKVRRQIRRWWERLLVTLTESISTAFPGAPAETIDSVAYALTCLAEQHYNMEFLGVGKSRREGLKTIAYTIVCELSDDNA